MATLEENYKTWSQPRLWTKSGENWSVPWGNSRNGWNFFLLPKIKRFLPVEHILEIGYGYGRWVPFLLENCKRYSGVDIAPNCFENASAKYKDFPGAKFYQTDGMRLDVIADESVDFIFSFDSLVHADKAVMESYIAETARVLKRGGVAFIHHSNLERYRFYYRFIQLFPKKINSFLCKRFSKWFNSHARDSTVSASLVQKLIWKNHLTCELQEIFPWGSFFKIDCISIISKP